MNTTLLGGLVLTAIGGLGYAVGIAIPFPGRSFSVTAIMIGITLVAIGRGAGRAVGG